MKNKKIDAKRGSIWFLRFAGLAMGLAVFILSTLFIAAVFREWAIEFPHIAYVRYPIVSALILCVIAFCGALRQAMQLLNYTEQNRPFSEDSITALRNIKRLCLLIGALLVLLMPVVYVIADKDDAPGLIIFGGLWTMLPIAVGIFAGVLQDLIASAASLKSENDLTV